MRKTLLILGAILYWVTGLGGLAVHLWTILIAFNVSGFIAALLTLVFPVVSQIYWILEAKTLSGTFFTKYSVSVYAVVISYGLSLLFVYLGGKNEESSGIH